MSDDTKPIAFDDVQTRALSAVLDTIIPASDDDHLPSAGEIGIEEDVAAALGKTPEIGPAIHAGLAAADAAARERGADDLAALALAARSEVLSGLAGDHPALLPPLIFHTYTVYYQQPRVAAGLGIPGRPPYPEGYDLEQGDLSLADAVRDRGPIWREC